MQMLFGQLFSKIAQQRINFKIRCGETVKDIIDTCTCAEPVKFGQVILCCKVTVTCVKVCIPFKKGINFFEIRKAFLGISFGAGITSLENDANKKQKGKRLHGFGLAMKFKLFIVN